MLNEGWTPNGTTNFGRYRIDSDEYGSRVELGKGGTAITYKGFDPLIKRPVVIKVLNQAFSENADFAGRFLRESQVAAQLHHPSIATIFDVGEQDGAHFIVMEWVDGLSLSEKLRQEQSLCFEQSLEIGVQVAEALQAGHQQRIVHRDIKPANILIFDKNGKLGIKLIDFGIAKIIDEDLQSTVAGQFLGTPIYASPEQLLMEPLCEKSDIYSLGVTIFQLLTGALPFTGTSTSLYTKITKSEPPLDLLPTRAHPIRGLLKQMLQVNPSMRPTAGQVVEQLQRLLADPRHFHPHAHSIDDAVTEISLPLPKPEPSRTPPDTSRMAPAPSPAPAASPAPMVLRIQPSREFHTESNDYFEFFMNALGNIVGAIIAMVIWAASYWVAGSLFDRVPETHKNAGLWVSLALLAAGVVVGRKTWRAVVLRFDIYSRAVIRRRARQRAKLG